jgi:hypothetical protein
MGKRKRIRDVIEIHGWNYEYGNRSIQAAESKRAIAEAFEVPESTLRKRLKTGTVPTSLGRFKVKLPDEEDK